MIARHHRKLLGYVASLLSDRARADDVMQEVWLGAFRHIGQLRLVDTFRGWLQIAVIVCGVAGMTSEFIGENNFVRNVELARSLVMWGTLALFGSVATGIILWAVLKSATLRQVQLSLEIIQRQLAESKKRDPVG